MDLNEIPGSARNSRGAGWALPGVPTLIALAAGAVWLVAGATPGRTIPESTLGQWMVLPTNHFDLRAPFSHHLLHANWVHLLVNVAAVLHAGRIPQAHLGTLRFT